MSLWVIPIFFGLYFLLATMIARLRAELGFLVHDLHRVDPHGLIVTAFGSQRLTTGTKAVFSLYMFFNRAYRAHPMPQELEALKISERRQIHPRHTAAAILIATLIGAIVVFWLLLDSYYRHGAETGYYGPWALGFGRGVYRQLENWLNYPQGTDTPALIFMGGGVGFSLGLNTLENPLSVVASASPRLCHGEQLGHVQPLELYLCCLCDKGTRLTITGVLRLTDVLYRSSWALRSGTIYAGVCGALAVFSQILHCTNFGLNCKKKRGCQNGSYQLLNWPAIRFVKKIDNR